MGVRENRELVLRLYREGYPKGPRGLGRFFAPEYVDHSGWNDLEGLKATLHAFHEAYPSARWHIDDVIAEGERVVVRSKITVPAATGIMKTVESFALFRLSRGRIVEHWSHGDSLF